MGSSTTNVYLRKKIEERTTQSAVLQSMQQQAADAGRDMTEAERKTFDDLTARLTFLDAEIERISNFNQGASKFVELIGAQNEAEERATRARNTALETAEDRTHAPGKELATRAAFGRRFIESPEFKQYNGSGSSGRVELPGPASPEFRAAIMLSDFDELPKQLWVGPPTPQFSTPLLDVLGRVATTQAAVLYLYWPPPDPVADVVPEGEPKPEAQIQPQTATIEVETVAHWKGVTRQALEDIAQIQSIVQNKLLQGVRIKLEQLAAAALMSNTDIPTASGATLMAAIRVGIATVEAAGYFPNAILVNPVDAADLDLAAMAASFSGPVRNGNAWGLPIVTANIIPAGTAVVGNFAQGMTWFDRGVTSVYLSDSHQDFFIRNILVILAEARAAFAVTEPAALVKCTSTGEGNGGGNGGGTTPPAATGATAGSPGTFTPAGAAAPADLATLQAAGITASPTTAWTTDQWVVLGNGWQVAWNGTAWQSGRVVSVTAPVSGASVTSPVTVTGQTLPNMTVNLAVRTTPGGSGTNVGTATADSTGAFTGTATIATAGSYYLFASNATSPSGVSVDVPITVTA